MKIRSEIVEFFFFCVRMERRMDWAILIGALKSWERA
jgi:hypothetical protein